MSQRYFEITPQQVRGGGSVKFLSNQDHCWDLSVGKSLADVWPGDMSVSLNPEKPKDIKLLDYISNYESILLVSPKFRDFLRAQDPQGLEFLPVAIRDHKKRIAAKDYSVVNCVRVVDAVNQQKSDFQWDGLENPSMTLKRLVLNEDLLSDEHRILRLRFVPAKMLFREDVMQAIHQEEFSGVAFTRRLFGDFEIYAH